MEQIRPKIKRAAPVYYSESFKKQIIDEHLCTGVSKLHLQDKYGIRFKSAIATWMKALGYNQPNKNNTTLGRINQHELAKKELKNPPSSSELEAEIALLKRRLEDEQLRSEMYKRMIDIAEKEYKISIRKNSNTK